MIGDPFSLLLTRRAAFPSCRIYYFMTEIPTPKVTLLMKTGSGDNHRE